MDQDADGREDPEPFFIRLADSSTEESTEESTEQDASESPVDESDSDDPSKIVDFWAPTRPPARGETAPLDLQLTRLLTHLLDVRGSDLHLSAAIPPTIRVDGVLAPIAGEDVLEPEVITRMLRTTLNDELWTGYLDIRQVDYSLELAGKGRFRVNAYHQRGTPAAAFRAIEHYIPTLEELGVPPGVQRMMNFPYGLVLFVGPTGSGKSTTQASLIDRIAATRPCHILTIEDPVEYIHRHQVAIVSQREVGTDVRSFAHGLRAAMREDPDVILLGEMRDEESISTTLTLAETGHLVFATLHTNDASQSIDRLIDSYSADRRDQIQTQLASVIQGVVSQRLVRRKGGGRVGAFEVMIATEAVRNLIREGKTRQIRNVISTGSNEGMQTLEASLDAIVHHGLVTYEEALTVSQYPKEIRNPAITVATQAATATRR